MAKHRPAGRRAAGRSRDAVSPPAGPLPEAGHDPVTPQPAPGGRRAGRRRSSARPDTSAPTGLPSMAEVGVYGSLATVVAVVVLIANGRPWWHAGVVVGGAAVLIAALKFVSAGSDTPDGPPSRRAHGRRRR